MTEDHSAAFSAFIDQLNELKEQAGNPSFPTLRKLSRLPLPNGEEARELAISTTQEILSGKRSQLPTWEWVISFVVACHRAARKGYLESGSAVSADVQTWRARWLYARSAERAAAAPDGRPLSVGSSVAMPSTDQLTDGETIECYRETHGRSGARLARLAMAGDAEACFQLALLTLLRGWGHDGAEWLRRAVDAGHAGAIALRNSRDLRTEAAAIAYQHGRMLEANGINKTSIASYYYRLAAETGYPQAVEKITPMAPQESMEPTTMPLAAPDPDTFVGHFSPLLDDLFSDPFPSRHLRAPWEVMPPVIEPTLDLSVTACDSRAAGTMLGSVEEPMISN